MLRYISAPVLAIILSFAFPEFHTLRYDPLMITGFILAIMCLSVILLGFVMPRYYNIFIPPHRRSEGLEETVPNEPKIQQDIVFARPAGDGDSGEAGYTESSLRVKSSEDEKS